MVLSNGNSCRELVRNEASTCLFGCLVLLFPQRGASLLVQSYPEQLHPPAVPHTVLSASAAYGGYAGSPRHFWCLHLLPPGSFPRGSVHSKFCPVCRQNVRVENSGRVLQKQRAGLGQAAVLGVLLLLPQEAERVPPAHSARESNPRQHRQSRGDVFRSSVPCFLTHR